MKFVSKSLADTQKIAGEVLVKLKATVLLLEGDLGSGKTAFVKGAAKFFAVQKNITSPTFVIMKIYPLTQAKSLKSDEKKLVHIDAYRLSSRRDLESIGFFELNANKKNIIAKKDKARKKIVKTSLNNLLPSLWLLCK